MWNSYDNKSCIIDLSKIKRNHNQLQKESMFNTLRKIIIPRSSPLQFLTKSSFCINYEDIRLQELQEKIFNSNQLNESEMTPQKVVDYLDKFVIGQKDAKKAIAISFRNRWRRKNLPEHIKHEITPKNLLIQGPTGCGKSQIAKRLAKLSDAPFLRVEATKYTEVGYVGKDVSSIIQDNKDRDHHIQEQVVGLQQGNFGQDLG